AMEIFVGCFGPAFKHDLYARLERLQQALGDINDNRQIVLRLQSLGDKVEGFRKSGDPSVQELRATLEKTEKEQSAVLEQRHTSFLTSWEESDRDDLFRAFAAELDRPPDRVAARPGRQRPERSESFPRSPGLDANGPTTVERRTIVNEDARSAADTQ